MEAVANGEGKTSPSSASKKLKQTRLPFQVLTGSPTPPVAARKTTPVKAHPMVVISSNGNDPPTSSKTEGSTTKVPKVSSNRKRKPSTSALEAETRAAKIGRIAEVKENVKDAPVVVLLDDESNSEETQGTATKTPAKTGQGESSEKKVSSSGKDKFMIKLPVSKRKSSVGRKDDGEEGGASSAKKKDKKKKKKSKDQDKQGAVSSKKEATVTDPEVSILIDDSELSDGETEKTDKEGKEESKEDKDVNGKEADAEPVTSEEKKPDIIEDENSAGKTEKDTEADSVKESKVEKNTSETVEEKATPKRRGRSSVVPKPDSNVEKVTPKRGRSAKTASVESGKSATTKENGTKVDDDKKDDEVEVISVSQESSSTDQRKDSIENKSENSENSKDNDKKELEVETTDNKTASNRKSARKSTVKKADDKTEPSKTGSTKKTSKNESVTESKANEKSQESAKPPPKPTKGALDKFFAKVQTPDKKAKCSPPNGAIDSQDALQEVPRTPEKTRSVPVNPQVEKVKQTDLNESMTIDEDLPEETPSSNPNNSTVMSICLDDSSDEANAEENAYMLCTPNTKERSGSGSDSNKKQSFSDRKLTPKQVARKQEAERKLALKQQEIEEKKRKKQEEKDAKIREKEEQERMKKKEKEEKEEQKRKEREEKEELKRKEKEEKDEQRKKEREEKEKKRLAEIEAKNEEKRKKDEQKEEERRKKEEEKEAEEKRKQKTAQAFQSFFVKKESNGKEPKQSDDENSMDQLAGNGESGEQNSRFIPFCVKGNMRLAPVCRLQLSKRRKQQLEEILTKTSDENGNDAVAFSKDQLYLAQIKADRYEVGRCDRTWIAQDDEAEEDDVILLDDDVCHEIETDPAAAPSKRYRAKFFLFEENRRPPYRGTWRKRSAVIHPRRPFVQDTKFFDYEVDSDDEWEEEEPGESLHGSDDEKDVDPEEEYEVDNDFFVPHGHLSDEEMQAEDDVDEDNSPETQKAKLKIMQQEFAAEMKKKTEKIKPRLIGCLWENSGDQNDRRGIECSSVIWDILKARAMLFDPEEPISFTVQKSEPDSNNSSPSKDKETAGSSAPSERKSKQVKLVDEGVKELINLIHGSGQSKKFLLMEFLAYWAKKRDDGEQAPNFSAESIRAKIGEIASWRPCPDEGPMQNKMCWYVNRDMLVKYELTDMKIPTGWQFILKPLVKKSTRERKDPAGNGEGNGAGDDADNEEGGPKKTPPKKETAEKTNKKVKSSKASASTNGPPTSSNNGTSATATATTTNITKFTKKLSDEDKRKQLTKIEPSCKSTNSTGEVSTSSKKTLKSAATQAKAATAAKKEEASSSSSSSTTKPGEKKRVQLLMSVPRGQQINQTTKNSLISKFLAKGQQPSKNGDNVVSSSDDSSIPSSSSSTSSDSVKAKKRESNRVVGKSVEAMEVDSPGDSDVILIDD
ncbi:chromatin assembly factor 1 subunit A-like isoform X1 [Uranotaenia lowii]|uniref:chromatin assembly factor 1 subunit A-like isoform X1 n=2 Tax=Uranotaenia lowii TaxID=190385 RepID=UPI0024795241|nr:chromatin assembly factor 1 subunit A-like isoform X1 [Uranotaenia lowii]